jgi:LexA DNA binding domain
MRPQYFGFFGIIEMNELTRRQRDVLARLQELYSEKGRPIHYSDLAQRLGINRFSAYDMLKVLERKGAVGSQYVLSKLSGPGRPEVTFYPLAQAARQALARLGDGLDWTAVKQHILAHVRDLHGGDADALSDLLADVPRSSSSLVFCGRAFAALVVSLGSKAQDYGRSLLAASTPGEGLDLFASLVLGLALTGQLGFQLSEQLVEYSKRCQQYMAEMDTPAREELAGFVHQLVAVRSS